MSPHGSKLWELVRFLANRFLTDLQRKKVKNFLARLQQVPLKVLGIDSLIEAQKAEIERLKSRMTLLEGKFNITLYGMPGLTDDLKAVPLKSGLLQGYEAGLQWDGWMADQVRETFSVGPGVLEHPLFEGMTPQKGLVIGLDSTDWVSAPFERFNSLSQIYLSDTQMSAYSPGGGSRERVQPLSTDPITALMALADHSLDFIISIYRFQRLAPQDQIHFLHLAEERLEKNGILYLVLPNLQHPEVRHNTYWLDPKNLRPYSIDLIKRVLGTFSGELKIELEGQAKELRVIYQKSRCLVPASIEEERATHASNPSRRL